MPEPDTFDLEVAFLRLEQDIAGLSIGPGASRAVSTARRRRRTTIGAVAAVAVLAAGGAVAGHGLGRDHAVGPADQLPAPAPLTAERLTSATAGWTPAWTANSRAAQQKMTQTVGGDCFPNSGGGRPDGYTVFGNSHDDLAITTTSDYSGDVAGEPVGWRRMVTFMGGCAGAQEVSSFNGPSGVAGHTYRVRATSSDSAPEYVWMVSTGQGVGVLKILGQSDSLPHANDVAVSDALVAAVESRVSTSDPTANATAQLEAEWWARFRPGRLQGALGAWPSGWHDGPPAQGVDHQPCGSAAWNGAGIDTGIGVDGRFWIHQFSSASGAEAGYQQVQDALTQCQGYTTATVTTPDGQSVLTARGDHDVWAIRHDDWVVVTYLPRAETPSPESVTDAMGSAMVGVVEDALASYRSAGG